MIKWYKNTSVWSTIIAICALALSQLPPVKNWIPNAELHVEHTDRIAINNNIGLIGHNLGIELENRGNRGITVYDIEMRLTTPNGAKKTLPAQTYTKSNNGVSLPLTSIHLSPGEIWSEFVFFNRNPSPSKEERLNSIKLSISQSIFDVRQKTPREEFQSHQLYEAEEQLVDEALAFFKKNFDLEKGTYKVEIAVTVEGKKEPFVTRSEFTIFDYHIETVKFQTDDYKYGAGIYYPVNNPKQTWVRIEPNKAMNSEKK